MLGGWLKRRRNRIQAEKFAGGAQIALERFADLIVKHPASFMDESWLPLDKSAMKTMLKIAIATEGDAQRKDWLMAGWVLLSQFLPGVGDSPVGLELPKDFLKQPTRENSKSMERYFELVKLSEADRIIGEAELRAFLATLKPTGQAGR